MAKDLVCGMEVDEEKATASSLYKDKKYYFCSETCKLKFNENPEKYIKAEDDTGEEVEEENSGREIKPEDKENPGLKKEGEGKEERVDLPILGMTCASCASTIQKGLSSLKGVDKANVNFANSKATVLYQPRLVKSEDLVSSVRKSGYEVGTASIEIPIQGMQCASCVQKIEKSLLKKKGVLTASVNLATEKAKVEYIPSETDLVEIKEIIEQTGHKVLEIPPEEELEDIERIVREKEYIKLKRKFFVGLILGMIIFLGSMPHLFPWVPDILNNFFILWLLATPVQFWIGWQFYKGTWGALTRRNADMNTLIAVGTSAAYLYSVVATLFPSLFESGGLKPEVFFDT
jgi:Cu+-exporting ATPase